MACFVFCFLFFGAVVFFVLSRCVGRCCLPGCLTHSGVGWFPQPPPPPLEWCCVWVITHYLHSVGTHLGVPQNGRFPLGFPFKPTTKGVSPPHSGFPQRVSSSNQKSKGRWYPQKNRPICVSIGDPAQKMSSLLMVSLISVYHGSS